MSLIVKIGADIRNFDREMNKLMGDVRNLTGKLGQQGMMMSQAVTLPLAGAGAFAVKTGMEFEAAMSQVKAASGATGKELQELEGLARELGSTTKYSGTEAAMGLTELLKAGQSTEQAMKSIPGVLSLASAGELEVAHAAAIATSALAQFKLGADQADRIGNVLAKTANSTKTSVDELGQAMVNAGPAAAAVGMDFETTNAILGIFANNGIVGANAGDKLKMVLDRLGTPTEKAASTLDSLGVSVYDAKGNMRPMTDVIGDLSKGLKGFTMEQKNAALSAIFGADAVGAANILLGEGEQKIEKFAQSLKDSSGYADEFAKTLNDNVKGQLEAMMGDLEEVGIIIFQAIQPALEGLISTISKVAEWFSNLSPTTQGFIMALAGLAMAIGPLLVVISVLINAFATIKAALLAVQIATWGAIGIWVLIGVAIAALVILIVTYWDEIVAYTKKAWGAIKDFFSGLWDGITSVASTALDGFTSFISDAWDSITEGTKAAWEGVKNFFIKYWPVLISIFLGPIGMLIALIIKNWDTIKSVTMSVWNAITSFLSSVWNAIVGFVTPIFNGIVTVITTVWNVISSATSNVWNFIWQYLVALWTALMYFVQPVLNSIGQWFSKVWNSIKSVSLSVWNAISSFLKTIWNGIKSVAVSVWNSVKSFFVTAINFYIGLFKTVWNTIKNVLSTIWKAIKSVAISIWNAIKNAIMGPINTLKSMAISSFNSLKAQVSSIFNSVKSTALSIWNGIKSSIVSIIRSLVSSAGGAFNGLKRTILNVWSGIKSGIRSAINGIISLINKFIGAFNSPAKALNKIPGVSAPTIPKIPMLATGGTVFGNGSAIVGEAGPELISKSGSSVKVTPLSAGEKARGISGAVGGGSGVTIQISQMVIREEADIQRVAKELNKIQERTQRASGRLTF